MESGCRNGSAWCVWIGAWEGEREMDPVLVGGRTVERAFLDVIFEMLWSLLGSREVPFVVAWAVLSISSLARVSSILDSH